MVVIRLSRGGAPKAPRYRVVVTNKSNARDSGSFIENIGYFNPGAVGQDKRLVLDLGRIDYWVSHGAQPSDRVKSLIKTAKKEQDPAKA